MKSTTASGSRRTPRLKAPRDRWLIAYADMVTLLMACFASLYASTLDKPHAAGAGIFDASSPRPAVAAPPAPAPPPAPVPAPATSAADAAAEQTAALKLVLQRIVEEQVDIAAIDVTIDARGLVISLPESGAFPVGTATLTHGAERVIRQIGAALRDQPNAVRIEGHTDDQPIRTAEFRSNWDLSTARATHVVQFLIDEAALPATRLSAAGYGQYRPRASNDTPAGRARNRRVDIVVLGTIASALFEPVVGALR